VPDLGTLDTSTFVKTNEENTFTEPQTFTYTLHGTISPDPLTADVEDWNPDGLDGASAIRVDGGGFGIGGLEGGIDGRIMTFINVGATILSFGRESSGSMAENGFVFPGTDLALTVNPNESITFRYDGTAERWTPINTALPETFLSEHTFEDSVVFEDTVDVTGVQNNSYIITNALDLNGLLYINNVDIALETGSGTKIGTDPAQKMGFYGATPIVQPAANADTSGATLGNLEIEVNQLKALLRSLGLMAT